MLSPESSVVLVRLTGRKRWDVGFWGRDIGSRPSGMCSREVWPNNAAAGASSDYLFSDLPINILFWGL
jgi:hypothetical protein